LLEIGRGTHFERINTVERRLRLYFDDCEKKWFADCSCEEESVCCCLLVCLFTVFLDAAVFFCAGLLRWKSKLYKEVISVRDSTCAFFGDWLFAKKPFTENPGMLNNAKWTFVTETTKRTTTGKCGDTD
jgi:hypothetical protein